MEEIRNPEVAAVARQVAAIIRRTLQDPRYQIFLFGSWATGEASEQSDIDIGIEGPAPIESFKMQAIREACEQLPTLYTVDLVDFACVSSDVRDHAHRRRLNADAP